MGIEQALSKARSDWQRCRPFFTRFAPELLYEQIRASILEEVREEVGKNEKKDYEFDTYFTYPTDEQMSAAHEKFRNDNLFFSEIRELVGYRAAEAISTLTALLSLEPKGATYSFIDDCLKKLWEDFSSHGYSRGYRTHIVRSNLILTLSSNNSLRYFSDSEWLKNMEKYFTEATDEWSGSPLKQQYNYILRVLRKTPAKTNHKHPIMRGCISLSDTISPSKLDEFIGSLYWDQGEPEDDLYLPPMMMHGQRRGPSQPPSDLYLIPFHIVRVETSGIFDHWKWGVNSHFADLAIKTLMLMESRTVLARQLLQDMEFTLEQATEKLKTNPHETKLILGQMIRVGLVEFDRISGLPWNHEHQVYVCTTDAEFII